MQVIFDFGETRHIQLEVFSIKKDEFTILSASYEFKKENSEEIEANGSCNIYNHLIDTVITPQEKGEYRLIITYKIADEVLIESVKVWVM